MRRRKGRTRERNRAVYKTKKIKLLQKSGGIGNTQEDSVNR